MIKKQIINEEILKSIESNYVYNNEPINRFKNENEPENIKLQLENLKNKISLIDNCDLKNNAKKMVFSDGNINSQVMIVGEGPGEKEDEIGKPFVGDAGNLLNKMLSAINLNRTNVYNYILNECGMLCDYDPCIYQGVLIKFYWNNTKTIQDGKCLCNSPCNGKGSGNGNGQCRKITVSVFQSGNIIITGKACRSEIYYIYNYIVELLHKNVDELKQMVFTDEPVKFKRRNISILVKNPSIK